MLGNGRGADVYVQSDAKDGLEALDALLEKRGFKQTGYPHGRDARAALQHVRGSRRVPDRARHHRSAPASCRAVDELVPGDIGLFIGNGASSAITTMNTYKARPYVHASGFFGCIGQMLPTAMGATIANGNKPAVLVDGDASTMMHLSDFDTRRALQDAAARSSC